ncbi:hypothetical protein CRH11_02020 [Bacillus velezensis]|nr:hypothetical protein B938_16385 [Bacillus velezensis AS43.3]AHK50689.1 hypothetical protein AJ82_18045 [Bacillus velezensis TrigoCor1448]AIW38917.1 hypothetical protein KS07_16095 [Bacillus subtilis]ATO08864.1 hypothetical protein CRH11_02020 [Bacillus velezensis]MBG9461640.1 hypothetical protein [Bacillus amyloliquefaciens]RKW75460.1 hypothetical protein D5S11_01700 [Bacillus sp. L75]
MTVNSDYVHLYLSKIIKFIFTPTYKAFENSGSAHFAFRNIGGFCYCLEKPSMYISFSFILSSKEPEIYRDAFEYFSRYRFSYIIK